MSKLDYQALVRGSFDTDEAWTRDPGAWSTDQLAAYSNGWSCCRGGGPRGPEAADLIPWFVLGWFKAQESNAKKVEAATIGD